MAHTVEFTLVKEISEESVIIFLKENKLPINDGTKRIAIHVLAVQMLKESLSRDLLSDKDFNLNIHG
jgi:glutaredoxin-related protein